jgi:hypothetical protein
MSFTIFLVYIVFTFLRPFEVFFPSMVEYRPMLVLWAVAFTLGIFRVMIVKQVAGRPVHFLLMGMLVLALALSSMARSGFSMALSTVSDFLPAICFMLLALVNLTSVRRLQISCITVVLSVLTLSAFGISAFHTGAMSEQFVIRQNVDNPERDLTSPLLVDETPVPATDKSGTSMWRVRSVGFLNDPNDFAQVLVMTLPMIWALLPVGRWFLQTLFLIPTSAALLYTIVLTQSRGAIIGLAAIGLLAALKVLGKTSTLVLAGVGLLGVLGMTFGGGRAFSSGEESAAQRIDAWWEGINLLKAYPIFGVGPGNFTDHHYLTAHNSFVLCFSELGLFGFFAWMGLIVVAYQGLNQVISQAETSSTTQISRMAEGLRMSLTGYLACAWFLSRTYSPATYLIIGLCVSVWYCAQVGMDKVVQPAALEPKLWKAKTVYAMAASIFGVYLFVLFGG